MRYTYDVTITRQEDGSYLVRFPEIPEAITDGDTVEEAREQAVDCLVAALGWYVDSGRELPPAGTKADAISVPPVQAAKLALYEAMKAGGISNTELAKRLGVTENAVRRLIDLDHRSHMDSITRALELLGRRVVLEVRAA
jgi:antitoxin HicB